MKGTINFKDYSELSDQEKRLYYDFYKLSVVDQYKGGSTKPSVISDNLAYIRQMTGLSSDEVRAACETIQKDINQLAFGGKQTNPTGFLASKEN